MSVFKNGSVWLKADFHLHTMADKGFDYDGDGNDFVKAYVDQLKSEGIGLGVITNHNKFDKDEFNKLRKQAAKNNIYLLPGIEFSLKEGIHILIVFNDKWYKGHENNIQDFLNSAFYGITNADIPPYPNSNCDLNETVNKLDQIGHDYFIVMAHVDADSGLFNVLSGRTLEAFVQDESFNRVLAVQKSGNKDKYSRLCSLANRRLACVEGSDNAEKGIDAIGKGRITYIKIGDFNFEAVKYALTDINDRIRSKEKPVTNNSYIKSISFEGGLLDRTEINFSPELNNFIGIRGSGKSSILEILRYTLGISLGNQASDREYKNSLIEHVLKSGGKVITNVVNEHKREYRIEKIYGQKEDIYENGNRIDVPSIDTVFKTPVYFGQKDLSNKNIDFEADLVKKLIGNKLENIKSKTSSKIAEIENIITASRKLDNIDELKKEINEVVEKAKYQIAVYKEKGVEDKLRQQSRFDSDISRFKESLSEISKFKNETESLINDYATFFNQTGFESEENKEIFSKADNLFRQLAIEFNKLNEIKANTEKYETAFVELFNKLNEKKENLKEDFAKIKREMDIPNLNPDDFLKLNRQIEISRLKLIEIEKSEKKKTEYNTSLNEKISELNKLWHEEYKILEKEVKRINEYENSLSITVEYKGRNDKFLDKLKKTFKGTGIREATYNSIKSAYKDFIEIHRDMKKKTEYSASLNKKISELNKLWHEEYKILEKEVKRINEYENSLSITVEYKGRDDKFLNKLKETFKGSGIREATYNSIKSSYKDFIEIYRDMKNLNSNLNISENLLSEFKKRFEDNIFNLISFRVEDKFIINYNDKPLKDHSLGQRATALILFLLAQKETNVLIIDQPEDDLDNQTIYEDVIKAIKSLKGDMQFIFATHNANIPVLGDSEKILSCKYSESKIKVHDGTIDNYDTQKQIVTIMEGGEEAFNRRKNIYELWSIKK